MPERENRVACDLTGGTRHSYCILDGSGRVCYFSRNGHPFTLEINEEQDYFHKKIHRQYRGDFLKVFEEVNRRGTGTRRDFTCPVFSNDRWIPVKITLINLLEDASYGGILLTFPDLDRKDKIQRAIAHRRYHDSESGLINREMFITSLRNEIFSAKKFHRLITVLSLSYEAAANGRERESAEEPITFLSRILRRDDNLCSCGPNDFFIFLSHIESIADLETVIDKIYYPDFADDSGKVSTHIGISFFPYDGIDALTLMERAKRARIRARKNHSRYEIFYNRSKESVAYITEMKEDIGYAIRNREFIIFFQPKVDGEQKICGAEALLRWNSPRKGWIYPGHFLPVAEKTGLMSQIDLFVLGEVCRQLNVLINKHGFSLPIAINVSPSTFENNDFHLHIRHYLEKYAIPPHLIELEITETGLMENVNESIIKLHAINNLGVKISIDDFGTGYSSLAELRDYPLDILKIDKSFVSEIESDQKASVITESIIAMAKALKMEIVAEGIEKECQFRILKGMGCEKYQGYLFGKPMPRDELLARIKKESA